MKQTLHNFISRESSGGILLMLAALAAMLCANSGLAGLYDIFLQTPLQLSVALEADLYGPGQTIQVWINDAFMTLFFLVVSLEIKREVLVGELSTRAKMLQPLFAALGGIVVPALLFYGVNRHHPQTGQGWAIPCATDIAFAMGVLALLGSKVPQRLKILLTAIAILDDLAAILFIAFFYSGELHTQYLSLVALGVIMLATLRMMQQPRPSLYVLCGIVVWLGFLKTGIHPTMAGVVTALFVPLKAEKRGQIVSPLTRLENALHRWVIFGVLPLFAFANAGLDLSEFKLSDLNHHLTIGILLGLLLGKPLGVMAGLVFGHLSTWAPLKDLTIRQHWGLAMLCGIGFTMSLFIGELAFAEENFLHQAKLGVLLASVTAAVLGWLLCRFTYPIERNAHV